jgi:hypothetical protein
MHENMKCSARVFGFLEAPDVLFQLVIESTGQEKTSGIDEVEQDCTI